MAIHTTPEEHDANPPSTWTVTKQGRQWALRSGDGVLATVDTKAKAEALKTSGFYFDLYHQEGEWFKGNTPAGWKPYNTKPMSFHFDCGNSTTGSIGFSARIVAESKVAAVARLIELLPEEFMIHQDGEEYIQVYFNSDAVNEQHIDDVSEVEEDDEDEEEEEEEENP